LEEKEPKQGIWGGWDYSVRLLH